MGLGECRGWLVGGVAAWVDAQAPGRMANEAGPELVAFMETPEARRAEWVPTSRLVEALTLADRIAGRGDSSLCRGIGIYVARREAGAVQALAMRILTPAILMSLAPSLWNTHFRDLARVVVRGQGERELLVSLVGVSEPTRPLCLAIGGWMEGFLGLGARRNINVEHVACACQGAPQCDYTVSWDE